LFLIVALSYGTEPVKILSDILIKEPNNQVIAKKDVVIYYEDYTIYCDKAIYDKNSKTITLIGHVHLINVVNQENVYGKMGELNLSTKQGYFLDAYGKFHNIYFVADKIIKDDKVYFIKKGVVSTCKIDKKLKDKKLRLCVFSAKVTNKYVYANSNILAYKKLPILYIPYAIFPVGKRRSGLLPPLIGSNTYNAFIYQQPIYFALSQDKDMTITPEYRNNEGEGLSFQYRQAFTKKDYINFNTYYFKEPSTPGEWWYGRNLSTFRSNRYRLDIFGRYDGIDFKLDTISDPYFMQDMYFRTNQRTIPYLSSYVNYSKNTKDFFADVSFHFFYDTTSNTNAYTLQRLPEIDFLWKNHPLFDNIYYNISAQNTYFYREDGLKGDRLIVNPNLTKTLSFGPFTNSTNINFLGTKYIALNQSGYKSSAYQVLFQNKTFFSKNFHIKSLNINNFYELSYNYQPFNNTNNPIFDYKDYQSNQNYLDFKINNAFTYNGYNFANVYLEDGYTFLKEYAFPTYLSSLNSFVTSASYQTSNLIVHKPLLPLRTTITFRPFQNLSYTIDSFYDFNKNEFPEENQYININFKKFNFYLGDSTAKDINRKYTLNQQSYGASYTYKTFNVNGGIIHDDISGHDVSRYLNLTYNGECYSLSLSFQEYFDGTRNQYINYVLLTFNVFNLEHLTVPISR